MRRLVYLTSARDNLAEILHHIARESGVVAVARAYGRKMEEHCEHLASLPGTLGTARPELREDIRSTPHQSHVIFFRYAENCLEVVNILNVRQDIVHHFRG